MSSTKLRSSARHLLLALLVSTAALGLVPTGSAATEGAPVAGQLPGEVAGEVVGQGVLETITCLACASVIIGTSGTTVLGVVATSIFFPEMVAGCGLSCLLALS